MRGTIQTAQSRVFAGAVLLAALCVGSRAHAGPVEQLVELASPPGKSDTLLTRYLNGGGGLFLSTDMGKTWSLQCDSAILGTGGRVQGPIAVLGDKTLLALTSSGVVHGDANGCGFKVEAAEVTKSIVDLVQHPTDAMKVYGAVSDPMGMSGLVERSADGQWTAFGVKDAPSPISLRLAMKGSALRIYEVAVKTSTVMTDAGVAPPAYFLRVSDDEAKTWQEYPIPAENSGRPRLRGVDPTNPDRLVIVVERDNATDTVLVSKDAGKTTQKYLDVDEIGGLSFAPDGRVWIADAGLISGISMTRGLYLAASLDAAPTRLPMATYPVQCVGWAPDTNTLYACQKFWFGTVDQMTGEFKIMMRFTDVSKFVTCPGEDPAMACKSQLCLDYCGPAHFAIAPVCANSYDDPACGKPVALMEGDDGDTSSTPSTGGSGGAGATTAAGSSAAGAAVGAGGMSVAGTTATAGMGTPAAGGAAIAGTGTPTKKSSGCSCAVPGTTNSSQGLGWLALTGLAAVWIRRRMRSRGPRH